MHETILKYQSYEQNKGEANYTRVNKIIFAAINYLKANDFQQYIFDEKVAMNKIKFGNQTKVVKSNSENKLANAIKKMHEFNIAHKNLLYFPFILEEFDKETIKVYLT